MPNRTIEATKVWILENTVKVLWGIVLSGGVSVAMVAVFTYQVTTHMGQATHAGQAAINLAQAARASDIDLKLSDLNSKVGAVEQSVDAVEESVGAVVKSLETYKSDQAARGEKLSRSLGRIEGALGLPAQPGGTQ